jgi:hypothetical protein
MSCEGGLLRSTNRTCPLIKRKCRKTEGSSFLSLMLLNLLRLCCLGMMPSSMVELEVIQYRFSDW